MTLRKRRPGSQQTLAILRFYSHHHDALRLRGNPRARCIYVKVPVTQYPWRNLQAKIQNRNFQFESLILAQNERWRQA
jgi:23S rRNA A1618 N6-methylase RlmF